MEATGTLSEDTTSGLDASGLPLTPSTILVAEDEHLLARSLCSDLKQLGFSVIGPAQNGQVAIDLANEHRPDMALLDIRMPGVDGLVAAEKLYDQHRVPSVILTAYSDPPYLQSASRLSVFGYILKPAGLEGLRAAILVGWARYLDRCRLLGEVDALKLKLEQRKFIERAKGLLMKLNNFGEEESMRALQKMARDQRKPMIDVAMQLLETHGVPLRSSPRTPPNA